MTVMTKRGEQDNVVTYVHFCDTTADMDLIEPKYITLGSACVVLHGDGDSLEFYLADSDKQWIKV